MFIRIEAPHFVAGVVPGDIAAPIISYMVDWSEEEIRSYCKKKGWKCTVVKHSTVKRRTK